MPDAALTVRATRLHVAPHGAPLFHEAATVVELEDEAAGEFVVVRQPGGLDPLPHGVRIDPEEWPAIREAIDRMVTACRPAPIDEDDDA